jgi:hypothetical protein
MGRNPGLAEDFNECIDFSFSPEEFEAKWALFVAKWLVLLLDTPTLQLCMSTMQVG